MELKKEMKIYYARALIPMSTYDLLELKIRTIETDWFVAIEKTTKQAFLFDNTDIGKTVFLDRNEALEILLDIEAKNKKKVYKEIYYEEY